jgi:hypothetical protein
VVLAHPSPPPHLPVSKLDRRHAGRLRKGDKLLTGDELRGWFRSRIIRPQERKLSLVLYKSFILLMILNFQNINLFSSYEEVGRELPPLADNSYKKLGMLGVCT